MLKLFLIQHLLFSLGMNHIFWIMMYIMVYVTGDTLVQYLVWCRMLYIITTYFMMASYFWMLCEAIYLRVFIGNMVIQNEDSLVRSMGLEIGDAYITSDFHTFEICLHFYPGSGIVNGHDIKMMILQLLMYSCTSFVYLINC